MAFETGILLGGVELLFEIGGVRGVADSAFPFGYRFMGNLAMLNLLGHFGVELAVTGEAGLF
jgi:hypothetical protein